MRCLCLGLLMTFSAMPAAGDAGTATTIPIYDRGTVTYYVDGGIDGYGDTQFLLDTGSAYVTIDEKTLAVLTKARRAAWVRNISGLMADGRRRTVPIYRISAITLGDRCEIRDVEAAVFPGGTRHILGLSALKEAAPFTVTTEPPTLALGNCPAISPRLGYLD